MCVLIDVYISGRPWPTATRTSDGGNGNHSVSLPIILLENKVDQMVPTRYISSLLVSILGFCI